ncbi:MAG TPA: sialidase family protein [Solirubrobacteraceae bacterium]|nr:sialidase family protein [Solirubrobacteraceae bacterium]
MSRRRGARALGLALIAAAICAPSASAANPAAGTIAPDATGAGALSWTGSVRPGTATLVADAGARCFGADGRPAAASGCDVFALDVNVPATFYNDHPGALNIRVDGFGALSDLDLYVYRRNPDGTRGGYVTGDGQTLGTAESVGIDKAAGAFYAVVTPYTALAAQNYNAKAILVNRQGPPLAELEKAAPPGVANYRASRDAYTSHSEPTIAMDPVDHDHLMAGSKMYENNAKYLFKVGTYESKDGGRTWEDQGHLPGYCQAPGQCDPNNETAYRTTSDPTIAFDDEGNAYANVLDAPGGTASFVGFNMTVHTKRPGQPWGGPTTVHDNRVNALTTQLFLDDKNWIAVDNHTDVRGGPNAPGDGKVGTMYICWSFDGTRIGPVGVPLQQIVVMRSLDAGKTWGGLAPKDNIPYPVSQKTLISGIGCHVAIGPRGEVYITWYDTQLNALMQSKSTNRGVTWSLAVPIAGITGVDAPFTGEAFRNLSIPTSAVDAQGTVYVAVASLNSEGRPLLGILGQIGKQIKSGELSVPSLQAMLSTKKANNLAGKDYKAGGDGIGPMSGSDIVLFKSTTGGRSYTGPVRVNRDPGNGDADQFQPWMAVTPSGQINISYFDRRNDPANYFIDTYLSRSEDGGRTFTDRRVSQRMWDPAVNAPTSVSGKFIGDYQGLVADDEVAIPFWNDTQLNALPASDKEHSPYQEVFAARVLNGDEPVVPSRCFPRRLKVLKNAIGSLQLRATRDRVGARFGPPGRTARGVLRFCVTGGGKVLIAFSAKGTVQLAATTAKQHRRLGIGKGSKVKALRRKFGRRVRSAGGLLRIAGGPSQQIVFGVREGRVTFVAVANRSLVRDRVALRSQLRRAGLVRAAR